MNQSSSPQRPFTVVCVTCYFKGSEFMRAAKRLGCRVLLITAKKLENEEWPRESSDQIFYVPDESDDWNMDNVIKGISYVARTEHIDTIIALDDYDVEKAAILREHLRVPGMGKTRAHYFRDKLAMRMEAKDSGIPVPEFTGVFNYEKIREYTERVPGPWLIKPRSKASALGIKKIHSPEELWQVMETLGDEHSFYVLEKFEPGDVFHVDSLIVDSKVVFARAHRYMNPPMQVAHEGGIFRSHNVEYGSEDELALLKLNKEVLQAFGLRQGASHTEFIKSHKDGKFYFLETSARVGGANIVEMVEASSGINLWAEWARIETLRNDEKYTLPKVRKDYAGIIISLARQEEPSTDHYTDSEIFWRMKRKQHVGLIVTSKKLDRVKQLLEEYSVRFYEEFYASAPLPEKPTN